MYPVALYMSALLYFREGVFSVCAMCVNMFYIVLLAGSNTRRKQCIIIKIVYTCILWHYRCYLFSTSVRVLCIYDGCQHMCETGLFFVHHYCKCHGTFLCVAGLHRAFICIAGELKSIKLKLSPTLIAQCAGMKCLGQTVPAIRYSLSYCTRDMAT
jgi:hypothetical protein